MNDRFVVQGLAGSGGMGTVYRALDRLTGARVALKVVAAEGAEAATRLAVEAEALAALDHPAIVRPIAFGTAPNGRPFLAMEWLDGEDLAARLERGSLAPAQVIALGKRVAEALAAAHERGIVHRDIKPHNLLLPGGQIERVKVVDFGLARLGAARRLTPHDALLGTPGYMAPEQARGSTDIDARADVFSLGAVLFECATGRPAFTGEHTMAVLAKLLLDEPLRVSALCPHVPPALARLVEQMLAKDRSGRPQRMDAVAAALEGVARTLEADGDRSPRAADEPKASASLTGSEQRLVSVVGVRPPRAWLDPEALGPEAETLAGESAPPALRELRATVEELRAALEPLGARVDALLDGSIVVTWMSADAPADQAARAARGALLVRRLVPGMTIAVASGLSDVSQPLPVGQVLDRAVTLLTEPGAAENRIHTDPVIAGLLDVRFQITRTAAGFELVGEEDIGQTARLLLGRPTPCLGRERELRVLTDLLDECVSEGAARAVLVTAPPGVGKSRLRYELLRSMRPRFQGVEVWQARGDPMSSGSTFAVLGSAIRRTAGMPSGAPLDARRELLRARVARHVPAQDRDRVAAFLGEMIGTPFPDEHAALLRAARQSAVAMVDQIRRAWGDFIAAECAAHPVLLVLEDLHWADASSVALLDATLGDLRDRPFAVMALARPEVHDVFPRLWARRRTHEIKLDGLPRRAAADLVVHVLGPSVDDARVAQLVDRAEGNAFYLEEMIRAVAQGHGGALPETVLAMVQARLDALTSDERRALRAASVFGEACWPGGVAALLGGDQAEQVDAWLDALVEREVLVRQDRSRFPEEHELTFRHALLRDGAYALLTEGDRALGHRLAAGWLERVGEADAAALAEHFERGGQPERAVEYRLIASERALTGGDIQGAIATAERIAAAGMEAALQIRREKVLVEAYWFAGDLLRADAHADELLALTTAGLDLAAGLCVKMMLAVELGSPERLQAAILTLMGAQATGEAAGGLVRPYSMLVVAFAMTGPRELAAHNLECAERLAAGAALDAVSRWFFHTARGQWKFVFESDFGAALREFEEALAWSERAGDSRWGAFSRALLGWTYNVLGDFERSEIELRRAIALSHRTGQAGLIGRLVLSWTLSMHGRLDEAEVEARRAIENTRGNGYGEGMGRTALAHVLMKRGDLDASERELHAAMDLLVMTPLLRTIVLAAAAELYLEQGRAREALAVAREALGGEGPCHIYPSSEYCARLAVVRALEALGDREGARAALAVAMDCMHSQAARVGDGALRGSFLRKPPWNDRLAALAADWLPPRGADPLR